MSNFVLAHIVVTLVISNSLSQGKFLGIVLKKEPISSFKFYLHVDREINFYFNFFLIMVESYSVEKLSRSFSL